MLGCYSDEKIMELIVCHCGNCYVKKQWIKVITPTNNFIKIIGELTEEKVIFIWKLCPECEKRIDS